MRTSRKTAGIITTIGIDLGKNTFHLVGFDQRGVIILQQKVSRGQLERRLANLLARGAGTEALPRVLRSNESLTIAEFERTSQFVAKQ
jgi:hypothetical protein